VNPTVKQEIKKTPDLQRRDDLLMRFNQSHFTSYNKSIFPFVFPATFLVSEEKETLKQLSEALPKEFKKDEKYSLTRYLIKKQNFYLLLIENISQMIGSTIALKA